MSKSVKILTGILGFIMLVPGLAKFVNPFKSFIYQHLVIIGFPFPEFTQYAVKFGEVGIGVLLLFLAIKGNMLKNQTQKITFWLANIAVIATMVVAIYTHLHPDVPAEILPMEYKPPLMGIAYICLTVTNMYLYNKTKDNG